MMKIRTILISLLILIFSLPLLVPFLYSAMSLCESAGCEMCGVIGHHINKWLSFFTNILNVEVVAFLVIALVILSFQEYPVDSRTCYNYKLSDAFDFIFLNPIKRIYAKTIIDPQIYN